MKRIIIIAGAVLLPLAVFAAEGAVAKGSPAYDGLESLSAAGAVAFTADKESLTRAEAAALADKAVENILAPDFAATKETIETAYVLLREFQTDLMEKGAKLSDLQQKMVDLKVMQERLNLKEIKDKQDLLFGMIGVKINGEAKAFMTDLVRFGPAIGAADRYDPCTQYIDMVFTASSGSKLKAEAVFRMENVFGGNWNASDIYGIRKFSITGDFPVSFTLGDFSASFTPYTLWAVDEEREAEAKLFRDKREMIKSELYLSGVKWPLTGGMLSWKTGQDSPVLVEASALAARIHEAGNGNYIYSQADSQLTEVLPVSYDQYMFGARAVSDLFLKDVLKAGLSFADIRDIKGTGTNQNAWAIDNAVGSVDAEIKLPFNITASGEFALSGYEVNDPATPEAWQNKYLTDTALKTVLSAEFAGTKAEAEFFVNGNSFTAYAAQARIYDGANNYPYLTQNNTWNVELTPNPYFMMVGKIYPMTRYNAAIHAGALKPGYNLAPYLMFENSALPYGGATPNRQGLKLKLSGSYLDGLLQPYGKFLMASEIVSYLPGNQYTCPREFMSAEGGLKIKAFGALLYGSYRFERTQNTWTLGSVDLSSAVIDSGVEYTLFERLSLNAGFKGIYAKGWEFPYGYSGGQWGYGTLTQYDTGISAFGGGIGFEVTKQASIAVSFTHNIINDVLNNANNFTAQELDARVSLKF